MNYYYSAKESGFYFADDIKIYEAGKGWPEDAIPVTDKYYQSLLSGQQDGKVITADSIGYPVLTERQTPTEELKQQANRKKQSLMQEANTMISTLQDAVDMEMATAEETVALTEWKKYRVLLMRVDTEKPVWPTTPEEQAS
ncbi:tail fiber assembly protein [Salmonella enterica subsp. enterica serovar Emek]|uniref:tail fiber assembly protein n=1 Tax=unclassified Salmonella TaxID=2614656 RepID=UPI000F90ABF7|nr:tail fiber assembly protein [Salmonella enterica]EBS6398412.1 tail fiber assembly protein [Salmonella enterica subsp. enterica serovar Emek]EBW1927204.1 tail fiber assembly protein [Salmonella enterica subsp. enterica serovar Give]ECT8279522.1 tail fiber assembly protein [Salmonella enterica subsp. enterica]HCZ4652270.1 tail fiber assembly protein [Salmonella enterica subsp. enterica serovar Saintpaul str. CFSAN004157]HCZ4691457.1 tail fiber assembly protein [Salmonella enterica subsp. ente